MYKFINLFIYTFGAYILFYNIKLEHIYLTKYRNSSIIWSRNMILFKNVYFENIILYKFTIVLNLFLIHY